MPSVRLHVSDGDPTSAFDFDAGTWACLAPSGPQLSRRALIAGGGLLAASVAMPWLAGCAGRTATPLPTRTISRSPFMTVSAHNPVLAHGAAGAWDSPFIDPGAMVFHAGQFHMFYDGSTAYPAPVSIGYATSPDGYAWTARASTPVLRSPQVRYATVSIFVTSALVRADGTWVLYFEAVNGGNPYPASSPGNTIGRATAPSPTGPWTPDPAPVLAPGPAGAWDSVTVSHPSVVATVAGYTMYYAGVGDDAIPRVGLATSPDGVHWTRHRDPTATDPRFAQSTPVLQPGNGWDVNGVMDPSVQQTPDGWVMSYLTRIPANGPVRRSFAFGFARSGDGVNWTKLVANPVLASGGNGWTDTFLSNLQYHAGTYFLLFDVATGATAGATDVYLATHSGALGG